MKKIISILLIVVVLVSLFSVTCFANNSDFLIVPDIVYPFFDLNWETVSLDNKVAGGYTDLSTSTAEDVSLYKIDNVFSSFMTSVADADGNIMRTVVCGNDDYYVDNKTKYYFVNPFDSDRDDLVQGVAGGDSLTYYDDIIGIGFRCGSVFNRFTSPSLKFASFNDGTIDVASVDSYVNVSFIVPTLFIDELNDGNNTDYYDFTWHFSADIAYSDTEEVFFANEELDVSFGRFLDSTNLIPLGRILTGGGSSRNCDLLGYSQYLPSGFSFMTLKVPLGTFLYNVSYNHQSHTPSDTSDDFYGCYYRNLEFYPTFNIDTDYLVGVLSRTAEIYGDSQFIQDYYDLLGDGSYIPSVEQSRCLPLYSVYTLYDNVDYDVQALALDSFNGYFNGISYEYVSLDDFNLVSWIGNTLGGVLDIELIPGISITTILVVVIGLGLLFIILKFFVGG